ncbi:MAG: hypothetical protein J7K61_01340 [Thermoplasmata archaeon]|nr:hypothetical protein [Thermoplasmata archaeon]
MQIKKILNEEEIEKIKSMIQKNYGTIPEIEKAFLTSDDRIWLTSKDINFSIFDILKRCYRIGIYFGRLKRNDKIKLSMEGAIIVGKNATRNVALVDDENAMKFLRGEDINEYEEMECEKHNFIIVKRGNDTIGVGILRDGYIENLVPKARRINF